MTPLIAALIVTCMMAPAPAGLPASVTEPYLRIQTALAGDKTDGVKADALAIAAAAKELEEAEKIAEPARQLAQAKDIEAARKTFGVLSEELVARAGKSGDELKIAYCPMAGKHWLQKGSSIRNPYFGNDMLTCGEIQK
ncbi:MAG: DUF3347 domain-containing protein [Vicinamibacterales bacterium]